MEAVTTSPGQINPIPFQIGPMPTDGAQASQDGGADGSPFTAILETMLGHTEGQTDQVPPAGGQTACPEIRAALSDFLSSRSGAVCLNGRKAGQTVADPIIALMQQIRRTKDSETDPKALAEGLSGLTEMLAGQKASKEEVFESEGPLSNPGQADHARARGIEQAILLSVARLFEQKGPVMDDEDREGLEGEEGNKEDPVGQNRSSEGVMAEIAAILLLTEKYGPTTDLSALPQPGKDVVPKEDHGGDVLDGQSGHAMEIPSQLNSSQSDMPVDVLPSSQSTGADPGEENPQAEDNKTPVQAAPNGVVPSAVPSAIMPPPAGSTTAGDSEESAKFADRGRQGRIEPEVRPVAKAEGGQVPTQGSPIRGEDGDGIGKDPACSEGRVGPRVSDKSLTQASRNTSVEQNSSVARGQGQDNDAWHHAKILYSRVHEANEDGGQQMMAQGQQAAVHESNGPVKKVVGEVQSILGKSGSVDAAEPGPSSKSQSFAKGEGDSQSLGQGMAEQRFTERATTITGSNGTTSFGDIVAERIARTVEHIAQTNRSDLTLRLKIDGGESVILEMKERAGTVVIGIQCQDKALAKSLESQKDLIVRNLETKNVSTSLSISTIGDDERQGQRQWQRERHSQQRDNWSGGQSGSHSYFETLI